MSAKRPLSTPVKTPRVIKVYRRSGTTPKKRWESQSAKGAGKPKKSVGYAARCIEHYEYRKAFTYLYNNFAGARRAVEYIVKLHIRKGVRQLLKDKECFLNKECSLENMTNFKWTTMLKEIGQHVPLLTTALKAAATKEGNEKTLIGAKGKPLTPAVALASAILFHSRAPHISKFVQGMQSLDLWRCGAQRKLFYHLYNLGLCTSYPTALKLVSNIRVLADNGVLIWRRKVQEAMGTDIQPPEETHDDTDGFITEEEEEIDNETDTSSELCEMPSMSTSESAGDHHAADDSSNTSSADVTMSTDNLCPGYTMVWDNVGKMVKAAHQSTERQNKMMLWALSLAVENRVFTSHMDDKSVKLAADIPLHNFIPMEKDLMEIRQRMTIIVSRIIVEEVPFFRDNFSNEVTTHIRHQHWRESSQKSNVINLGVCQENPSTTAGTIKILENIQQYVPYKDEDHIYPLIVFGDGLSCERHNDAHMARSNGETVFDKLQGVEPQVQEFHKQMLLMQDVMDTFFSGSSATDKGTLFHLKNVFGHRSVKKDIGETFNHASEFIRFVTYGYTILATLKVSSMDTLDDRPVDMTTIVDKQHYLETIAKKVVDLFWQEVTYSDILEENTSTDYIYCSCKEDQDLPMIECSGFRCPGNNWFHLECLDMDEDDVPDDDYYCSSGCRKRRNFKYCCNVDTGETMIACDNPSCPEEWYHMKCIGLAKAPRGKWYCNQCKGKKKSKTEPPKKEDYKFNYVTSLTFSGLMDLVRRDAVRENDGNAMMSHWRFDMPLFHNRHHPKYVLLGHRLLAGVAGWLPERMKYDSMWNRTINLAGGPGRSLPADLVNEFTNKEFKESLKEARGNITDETVARHSQMVGSMGKVLDRVFTHSLDMDAKDFIKERKLDISKDLRTFIDLLGKEELLSPKPGREFKAFPEFKYYVNSTDPVRLRKKLEQLSTRLDKIRRCCKS